MVFDSIQVIFYYLSLLLTVHNNIISGLNMCKKMIFVYMFQQYVQKNGFCIHVVLVNRNEFILTKPPPVYGQGTIVVVMSDSYCYPDGISCHDSELSSSSGNLLSSLQSSTALFLIQKL